MYLWGYAYTRARLRSYRELFRKGTSTYIQARFDTGQWPAYFQHMAARLRKTLHDSETRQRIQTAHIVRRLTDAFNGDLVLDGNQISIGIALLRKTLPDLSQVESHNQTEVSVISAEPMSPEAWASQHGATGETRQ